MCVGCFVLLRPGHFGLVDFAESTALNDFKIKAQDYEAMGQNIFGIFSRMMNTIEDISSCFGGFHGWFEGL